MCGREGRKSGKSQFVYMVLGESVHSALVVGLICRGQVDYLLLLGARTLGLLYVESHPTIFVLAQPWGIVITYDETALFCPMSCLGSGRRGTWWGVQER